MTIQTRIQEYFYSNYWAMKQDLLSVMSEIIDRHASGEKLSHDEIELRTRGKRSKSYSSYEVVDSKAIIPIHGIIAKRASMVNGTSQPQGTSVEEIRDHFLSALDDSKVNEIILDVDSPGGSVGGVSELSDLIFESRGKKKITAYTDGLMASAAYWIGSAADQVFATKTSSVGSIGVYTVVSDYSVMNHQRGIKREVIKAGENKATGNPEQPLTSTDRAVIQEEINDFYDLFVQAVARNRSLSLEQAGKLANGRVYIGQKAKAKNLIDGIGSLDLDTNKSTQIKIQTQEETLMDYEQLTLEGLRENRVDLVEAIENQIQASMKDNIESQITQARDESKKVGISEGQIQGETEERNRILSIMDKSQSIPGSDAFVKVAIEEGDSAQEALERFSNARLEKIRTQAPKDPGPNRTEVPTGEKTHLERAKEYQSNHGGSITDALKATV